MLAHLTINIANQITNYTGLQRKSIETMDKDKHSTYITTKCQSRIGLPDKQLFYHPMITPIQGLLRRILWHHLSTEHH